MSVWTVHQPIDKSPPSHENTENHRRIFGSKARFQAESSGSRQLKMSTAFPARPPGSSSINILCSKLNALLCQVSIMLPIVYFRDTFVTLGNFLSVPNTIDMIIHFKSNAAEMCASHQHRMLLFLYVTRHGFSAHS
jgi:hypothetical protein